jgi:DNA-binding MarR family transcriptional regulator
MDYGKLIKLAANQMNRRMDAYAKQYGLTGTQMSILDFLAGNPHALQRDIEVEFNIQRSTATVTLQRMEKAGLVSRVPAATDARQKEVHLTNKAQALSSAVAAYIAHQQMSLVTHFSEEEQATFTAMLQYFIELNGGNHHQ